MSDATGSAVKATESTSKPPSKTASKKKIGKTKAAAKPKMPAPKAAAGKSAKSRTPKANLTREGSKKAMILDLLGRSRGATLSELMTASGWQAHSVRAFISTLGKKQRAKIDSAKNDYGERVYKL